MTQEEIDLLLKEQRRIIRNHWQEWAEEQKQQFIDKACEWLKNNWREYIYQDRDGIVHFGRWESDFRKAMEE